MSFLNFFRRQKVDQEAERKSRLLRSGRIAEARVFDVGTNESGAVTHVFYSYNVGGVDYESSQILSDEQRAHADDYAPGVGITVRFDPRQPTNSVVV